MPAMLRWFDVGEEAQGVIAIGARATGVIAIGQLATGVIAIGQVARGVFCVGQLAAGMVVLGQLSFGVTFNAAMLGVGGTSPGWFVLPLFDRRRGPLAQLGEPVGALRLLGVAVLMVAWYALVATDLVPALLGTGGILRPLPG